jgi:transcriptional regulator with XRE-family HTH domain
LIRFVCARVNQYERGKHAPDYLTLEHFARVLKVDVAFFYARDEETARFLEIRGGLPAAVRAALSAEAARLVGEAKEQ